MFDLPADIGGVNDSERLLAKLCQKSFLSLWSYANLFTDEDLREGKGSGKELCDVLVVFGDDVIIFSDKHIAFQTDKDLDVAWPRWYKRAVSGSVRQLYGACNWLKRFPDRVFQDAKCTRPLPVRLPPAERARYHLVAVTRGSLDACKRYFDGGFGTPVIDTMVVGDAHLTAPFRIGIPLPNKPFVHVFDEFSLELIHQEQDTIKDFTAYLTARENFLGNAGVAIFAAGEEQLLSAYLMYMDGENHSFLPGSASQESAPDLINFDSSFFENLQRNTKYLAKKEADKLSYFWDDLVEKFIRLGDHKLVRPDIVQSLDHMEEGLRIVASESRFRRRILAEAFEQLAIKAARTPGSTIFRTVLSEQGEELIYVFLIIARREGEPYDAYRHRRSFMLSSYCMCAKLKFEHATTFVGLGFDHPVKNYEGGSEDLMVLRPPPLTEGDRVRLNALRQELGILSDTVTMQRYHATEYPPNDNVLADDSVRHDSVARANRKKDKSRKNKKKVSAASKRRNRR